MKCSKSANITKTTSNHYHRQLIYSTLISLMEVSSGQLQCYRYLIKKFSFLHKRYRDCGILEWNPVPFPIPSRTRIPSRYRFLRDTGWGLIVTIPEICYSAPSAYASSSHNQRKFCARRISRFHMIGKKALALYWVPNVIRDWRPN